MAVVVSFINFKGGVGKTTLCVEIAASLAYKFKERVLIIDLDPQTNATLYLMREDDWKKHAENNGTLYDLFQSFRNGDNNFDISRIIVKKPVDCANKLDKLDLIPSNIKLFGIDLELAKEFGYKDVRPKLFLRDALKRIQNNYEYIFIDCPPNLYLATQNGLFSSNYYVIVALAEYLSTVGIALINKQIKRIFEDATQVLKSVSAPPLKAPDLLGIMFNKIRTQTGGTSSEKRILDKISKRYPKEVFNTFIPQSTKIAERAEYKVPIAVSGYAADRDYEERMEKLAEEFYDRITRPQ